MGNVTGSVTASGTAVTSSGGATTLTSDEIEITKLEPILYDTAMSTVNKVTFSVPSPGGEFTFRIKAPVFPSSNWLHAGSMAIINFLGLSSPITVTFTANPSSVDEGAEAVFTIQATNVEKAASLQWTLVHVGTLSNNSHYTIDGTYNISGAVTLDSSATPTGTIKIKPILDGVTNPTGKTKQFKIEIKRNGILLATSNTVTVNESDSIVGSTGPTYSLSLSSTSVDEGDIITGTITAVSPKPIGEVLSWSLVDVSGNYASDINRHFEGSGTVRVADGTGGATFTIQTKEDNLDNPDPKSFKVMLHNSDGIPMLATAVGPVTVNDTSKTPGKSASGGSASVSGLPYLYQTSSGLYPTQDAGYGLYFFSDGTWKALSTSGTTSTGNWFTPTTTGIGSNYWITITSTPSVNLGAGGTHSANISVPQQLTSSVSCFAAASGYRCVDPETPILIDDAGTTELAGELQIGDEVYTMHEHTRVWGYYKIINHEIIDQPRLLITFTDNSTLLASESHKVFMGKKQWLKLSELKPGYLVCSRNTGTKEVLSIESAGIGPVVSMEIDKAHTYIANDIISHNKASVSSSHSAEYERIFTITIGDGPDFGSATLLVATITIGGQTGIPM